MKLIIYINNTGKELAELLCRELDGFRMILLGEFGEDEFRGSESVVFIGSIGICMRRIAVWLGDKHSDPGVVCIDSLGRNVVSLLSGHIGGGNALCRQVARVTGGRAVVTTQSDNRGIWALDTLSEDFGWVMEPRGMELNGFIARFVEGAPVGLLLDVRDRGSLELEATLPDNVRIINDLSQAGGMEMIIAVTPYIYDSEVPVLYYRPFVMNLGFGCRRDCDPAGVTEYIEELLVSRRISPDSVVSVSTITLKKDERVVRKLSEWRNVREVNIYDAEGLADVEVPNPSGKVREVTGVWGVAESCALSASGDGPLVMEKVKCRLGSGSEFTVAVAMTAGMRRGGHIEIVGAGPGDPDLISVRGRRLLSQADLILYAGSLVPVELTHFAKEGCVVRSSASMDLEAQFSLMKEFYDRGLQVVRLHTGDPCIYGAIQEQMAYFDKYGMDYHITPGISSFQAAAAALRSQFTIPEKVQTVILTRGGGRTPMPEREQLHKLARSCSTMCIFLSAGVAEEVQRELLMEYAPDTPVAVCHKLTWRDEKIFRGELRNLASIVKDNGLTLTTLIVVGEAIGNRKGNSRLYSSHFKHLFRK